LVGASDGFIEMATGLSLGYSLAGSDDAIFMTAVALVSGGLLRTSWHEAADSVGVVPASALSRLDQELGAVEDFCPAQCGREKENGMACRPWVICSVTAIARMLGIID